MERSKLSLKWLEVFQAVSRQGTVRDGAENLGISISTASHHLACLERAIGTQLLDHGRRPMRLTPAGEILLRRVDEAMWILRKGVSEIWSEDLQSLVRLLRIAHIEDFDADVAPVMVEQLARAMPFCDFSILSRPTHEIAELLQSEQIDVGIASSVDLDSVGIVEEPILRDPFIVVAPADIAEGPPDLQVFLAAGNRLPLLRYSKKQLLGRRIEAQLRRLDLRFAERMEFESTHMILSMVASGRGWTITTALTFARAQRYHSELRAMPFPGKAFSRQISLFRREDVPASIQDVLEASLRNAVQRMVIEPTVGRYPWLADRFGLIPKRAAGAPETQPDRGGAVTI